MISINSICDYGIIVNFDLAKEIAKKKFPEEVKYFKNNEDYFNTLYESGIITCLNCFTGDTKILINGGKEWFDLCSYEGESIYYIPLLKASSLFFTAYKDYQAIIDEIQNSNGQYLSKEFDYNQCVYQICGICQG